MTANRVQLLTPDILKKSHYLKEVDRVQHALAMQIGWHYALDLIWILEQLEAAGLKPGARILDAGAGQGLLQFLLAERGFEVLSVDFSNRRLPVLARLQYHMQRSAASVRIQSPYAAHLSRLRKIHVTHRWRMAIRALRALPHFFRGYFRNRFLAPHFGRLEYLQADLTDLASVESASVDAVVSVSVIEHIPRERTTLAIAEMSRVVKPGGLICVTTSAAADADWYHEPSKGWCFTESTLRRMFGLPASSSTWGNFEEVRLALAEDTQLRKRMPESYRWTANCGLPWGIWDPKYVPVGIALRSQSSQEANGVDNNESSQEGTPTR